MPTIQAAALRRFAADLLAAGGFARDDAEQSADLLVWANLRGERGASTSRMRALRGIRLAEGTVRRLNATADELDVPQ